MAEERRLSDQARRLLRSADLAAERATSLVRMGAAASLLLALWLIVDIDNVPGRNQMIERQIDAAELTLSLLFALGLGSYAILRLGRWTPVLSYVTATLDFAILLGNVAYNHVNADLAGDFMSLFPAVWVAPVLLAASALRYRPVFQIYLTALCCLGLLAIAIATGSLGSFERAATLPQLALLVGPPPNMLRLMMLAVAGLVLAAVAWRGRLLLVRAIEETSGRLALTRYLPAELTELLSDGAGDLRRGRRQDATVMFVDMRDSTAIAEAMTPEALGAFITEFRGHVSRTVREHGGLIDKFIGDGALVLFGVPEPKPDDAARAIACAQALVDAVVAWDEKRRAAGEMAVAIGIGLHHGPVFFGVVGDPARLEATVLGDTVSVAARLEEATKTYATAIVVSGETLDAAGLPRPHERLCALGRVQLRGLSRDFELCGLGPIGQTAPASTAAILAS